MHWWHIDTMGIMEGIVEVWVKWHWLKEGEKLVIWPLVKRGIGIL
jgi:hypothetical protein